MKDLVQDFQLGLRRLVHRPLLTVAISLSLALGIGANTAIFSLVNTVLFRPLAVGDSSRLVSLYTSDFSGPQYGASSYADFVDFRDRTGAFEDMAAFTEMSTILRVGNQSDRASGLLVSGNYFDLLGVGAERGRTFLPEDDRSAAASPVVVVSHGLWQSRFGGDPGLVGKPVYLNGRAFTVIGVTPERFTGTDLGRTPEIFVPSSAYEQVGFERALTTNRGARSFSVIGRLERRVDARGAQAALDVLANQLFLAHPDDWKDRTQGARKVSIVTLNHSRIPPEARTRLMSLAWLFLILVGLVLMIACSNVSNLLLARATSRQREMVVRAALGASRKRLVRQLLTESLQLSLLGSALGLLIAPVCLHVLAAALLPPSSAPIPLDIGINGRVILFTLVVGLCTGLAFGLVPALHASKTDLMSAMRGEATTPRTGERRFGIRNLLAITQVAVSLTLLIVAGMFTRSLQKAQRVDLGYKIDHVLTTRPEAEFLESGDPVRTVAFYRGALERVRAMPDVLAASLADTIPSGSGLRRSTIGVEDYAPRDGENMDVLCGVVGSGYFRTMGMTLSSGREFTDRDDVHAPRAAVVNETMARRYWPGRSPLGRRIRMAGAAGGWIEVVGVVKDVTAQITQPGPWPFLYLAWLQDPSAAPALHVRTRGDAMAMLPALRREIEALQKGVTLRGAKTLSDYRDESLLMLRIASTLTGLFGLLAWVLALTGVFSVINYSASRRTREMGIRRVFGAQRLDIIGLIMKEGLFIVAAGVVVGLVVALACERTIATFLLGSGGADWVVLIVLPALLAAVAMLACFIPAYRATRVEPMDVLRYE